MANLVNNGGNAEPNTAPQAGRWYNLSLGSSFKDNPSTKFCTLRYEFKPASIDKSQAGSLHKNKDNRVTVEFSNNQPGKPKVTFEGSSEDYKENDGVLFFDGETFRLERLHRAVKRLRHVRMPGESAAIAAAVATTSTPVNPAASVGTGMETRSPPLGRMGKSHSSQKTAVHSVPVEVERIDIGEPDTSGMVKPVGRPGDYLSGPSNHSPLSPDNKVNNEMEEHFHMLFGDDDDENDEMPNETNVPPAVGFGMPLTNRNDSDDEVADVDVSENEGEKGPNAAEALRAQVNAEEDQQQSSSSSGSSGSGSRSTGSGSGSGSGSSSGDSEASDDTASSGGDIDI